MNRAQEAPGDTLEGVANTAYYCCGVRMLDARRPHPVCGDRLAERFMDEAALRHFAPFETFTAPNASNATRHRMIDDLLCDRLAQDAQLPVLLLGAGFDTRAFRLHGGRWRELDHAALLARKEALLPATGAPNPLERIAIDFERDRLAEVLADGKGQRGAVVVLEGVSMYLTPDTLRATLDALRATLPGHTLVCDLMNATFVRRYSGALRQRMAQLGGHFAPPREDPVADVCAAGYRLVARHSIVARALELRALPAMPAWLLATVFRPLRDGYQVCVFDSGA